MLTCSRVQALVRSWSRSDDLISVVELPPGEPLLTGKIDVATAQRIRLKRFGMAVATYAAVMPAAFLVSRLGLGEMSAAQWGAFIGLAILGNAAFFALIRSGANLRFSDPALTLQQIAFATVCGMVPLYALPYARPLVLMFYLPAFSFGILRLSLRQYLGLVAGVAALYASLLIFEHSRARPGFRLEYELFVFVLFSILMVWFAVFGGYVSGMRKRLRARNAEIQEAHAKIQGEVEERKRAQEEKEALIVELSAALSEVKKLSGLLPICMHCKKIRDERGSWSRIETYIREHSAADFSHGLCPDCASRHYPEFEFHR